MKIEELKNKISFYQENVRQKRWKMNDCKNIRKILMIKSNQGNRNKKDEDDNWNANRENSQRKRTS